MSQADTVVGIELQVNANPANNSVKSFKTQLIEATQDVIKLSDQFGEASVQAKNAAKKVAELKDKIKDAKDLSDTFNPDKKFVAFGGALQGVTAGFAGLQGAMALFGSQSQDVEKVMLKVQSAMALQEGISGVVGAIDSFKLLGNAIKTQVVTSFSTLRGAIIATGLGALAVGVGLLIANFDKLKEAILNMFPGLGKLASYIGGVFNKITDFIGVTSGAERELQRLRDAADKSIAKNNKYLQEHGDEIDKYTKRKIDAVNAYNQAIKEDGADQIALQKRLNREIAAADKDRNDEAAKIRKDAAEKAKAVRDQKNAEADAAESEAAKKLIDLKNQIYLKGIEDENKAKKKAIDQQLLKEEAEINANEKLKAETKQALIIELRKKAKLEIDEIDNQETKDKQKKEEEFQKQLEKVKLEIRLNGIQDEYEKSKAQIESNYELQYKDIEKNETYSAEQKKTLKLALQQKENQELDALKLNTDKKKMSDDIAELDKEIEKNVKKFDIERELLDKKDLLLKQSFDKKLINEKEYNAGVAANAKARNDIDKTEKLSKKELIHQIGEALNTVSDIVGKNTVAGKAFAVASSIINTYEGITQALSSGLPPPLNFIQAAGVAAAGFKAVKNIIAVKVPGGGGDVNSSLNTPTIDTAAPVPATPTTGFTQLDPTALNAIGNATTRAFVVESDVADNQERITRLNRAARL